MSTVKVEKITTVIIDGGGRHYNAKSAFWAWSMQVNDRWWTKTGVYLPADKSYLLQSVRNQKMYNRALPIFERIFGE